MTLLTENQMHLKHLFISEHKCNGINDTYYFYALNLTLSCSYPEFHLLLLITATGTKRCFMWQELLKSS